MKLMEEHRHIATGTICSTVNYNRKIERPVHMNLCLTICITIHVYMLEVHSACMWKAFISIWLILFFPDNE